jgi:hypothetical protein
MNSFSGNIFPIIKFESATNSAHWEILFAFQYATSCGKLKIKVVVILNHAIQIELSRSAESRSSAEPLPELRFINQSLKVLNQRWDIARSE